MVRKDAKIVYTTDPHEAKRLRESGAMPTATDVPHEQQTIRVEIDRRRRKGKTVTVASGFQLTRTSLDKIVRQLKSRCAAGGRKGSNDIEIQGEHADTVSEALTTLGFKVRRIGRS